MEAPWSRRLQGEPQLPSSQAEWKCRPEGGEKADERLGRPVIGSRKDRYLTLKVSQGNSLSLTRAALAQCPAHSPIGRLLESAPVPRPQAETLLGEANGPSAR